MVFSFGQLVAKNGQMLSKNHIPSPVVLPTSMNVDLSSLDFSIPADGKYARVIEIVPNQIITRQIIVESSKIILHSLISVAISLKSPLWSDIKRPVT